VVGGRLVGMERRAAWISVPSPIGDLGVAAEAGEITAVHFGGVGRHEITADPAPVLRTAREQFDAYFAGDLTEFDLPLAVPSGSDFEQAVWKAIAAIDYADMATYGEIAAAVGDKDAARAVGVACNRNPLPIIVACHRVVGAGGKLVGFGGGLDRKRYLLQLEARVRIERDFQ
jgi:methylated-DNA-[protein]-cysteine S-methyltransferase